MEIRNKATRINLFDFKSIPMRTFHVTWFSFFLCFFGWFGIAPLMPLVREELGLTKAQIGNIVIASVAITIFVRLVIGWLCDKIGPRKAYAGLLILGALPVVGIGFSQNYETFLLFRLAIGAIGASFVITQYHTSVMFAPNCVGTANATAAGWGNLGGGVTQMVMPLILTTFLSLGAGEFWGWRLAMMIPGCALFIMGFVYYFFTKDYPDGNIEELRASGQLPPKTQTKGNFRSAIRDRRVLALAVVYGACFGVELTMNNIAALYFADNFQLSLAKAGLIAGLYGLMNVFARALGGALSDRVAHQGGLKARVYFLSTALFLGGIALIVFSHMTILPLAIITMIFFGLFIQMSSGATYAVAPFINKKALGAVAGIVGAGGNLGAVMFGFLFKSEALSYSQAFFYLGMIVVASAALPFAIKFSTQVEEEARAAYAEARARNLRLVEA